MNQSLSQTFRESIVLMPQQMDSQDFIPVNFQDHIRTDLDPLSPWCKTQNKLTTHLGVSIRLRKHGSLSPCPLYIHNMVLYLTGIYTELPKKVILILVEVHTHII
jgi:hypothetical protein